jgi:hypothetical protein
MAANTLVSDSLGHYRFGTLGDHVVPARTSDPKAITSDVAVSPLVRADDGVS